MTTSTVSSHFGLRYSPFTDTFPLREPIATEADERLLERMLLGQGKSYSLAGEPDSGKSMLLKMLLEKLDGKNFRTMLIPYSGQKPNTLLREICEKLAIDTTGRGSLLGRLHQKNRPRIQLHAGRAAVQVAFVLEEVQCRQVFSTVSYALWVLHVQPEKRWRPDENRCGYPGASAPGKRSGSR